MAAASLVQMFDKQKRDPRKEDNKSTMCPQIQKIIAEVRRFESIPNQQEPLDVSMIRHHLKQSAFSLFTSKPAAMGDFWIVGYHAGLRRSEWCQEKVAQAVQGREQITESTKYPGRPQAFTIDDIEFLTKQKKVIDAKTAIKHPESVVFARLRFHWQKNGDHDAKKLFVVNTDKPDLCPVQAWIRIVKRYFMVRTDCPTQTLSIYRDTKTGKTFNITADDVKSDLRRAAKALYDLSEEELAKFTCHSIRIGACCTLYSMGVPPEQIKKLLRWRSDCWMRYIRDLTTVANNQNAAITSAAELPCL